MKPTYLLDGKTVTGSELIAAAEVLGYRGEGGLFQTSKAARILREHGHTVEEVQGE